MADVSQIKLPNGSVYDLIDEKSGYITAEYIENKTDYEIPVSRVGEIVVGETAIGTDSTNFPTSKAVVDYVDERVVQEIDAIDVGVTGIKANGTSLAVENGVVNIPVIGPNQSVGLMTAGYMNEIFSSIPTSTSQLTNDSGFITSDSDEKLAVSRNLDNGGVYDVVLGSSSDPINTETKFQSKTFQYSLFNNTASLSIGNNSARGELRLYGPQSSYSTRIRSTAIASNYTIYLPNKEGTVALTSDIPSVPSWALQSTKPTYTASEVGALPSSTIIPSKTSDLTNDSGYLTASDIASVMTYKGTKANYAALPASGNTTGDVWHLTDTGAEWAWDGSAWQELGTAIDLSNYATKATTLTGYGITDAKIENGIITLGSNTITPLTSYTETDPTVPSWAKASTKPSYGLTEISGTDDLRAIEGLTGTSGLLKKTAANTWTLDTNTYLTSYTETDPTVPSWAKASTKPTYTAAEVGALPDTTTIPSKTSDLTNDSGFITSYTDEKVKVTTASTAQQYYLTFLSSGTTPITTTLNAHIGKLIYEIGTNTSQITLGNATTQGRIKLFSGTGSNIYTRIQPASLTTNQTITLPNKSGTIALTSDIPDTSSFLTSETDPVFAASAAAGITSTDISNWNAKVSDDKTWNGVQLNTSSTPTAADTYYIPSMSGIFDTEAKLLTAVITPTARKIPLYDSSAYLKSTTPSANDNSTKVATTAYVDSAVGGITVPTKTSELTNDSGFITSYTDEKLGLLLASSPVYYYPILTQDTTTAGKKSYDNDGFIYYNYSGTTSAVGNAKLTLGNNKTATTAKNKQGTLELYGSTAYAIRITAGAPTVIRNIEFPNKDGTLALTSDIPSVYSSTNTGGYLTMATLPIYDGTVV